MYNKTKRRSKITYYEQKFLNNKDNVKLLWKTINMVIGKNNEKMPIINHVSTYGVKIRNHLDIANSFSENFSNIGRN